jgi:hypothetical protein
VGTSLRIRRQPLGSLLSRFLAETFGQVFPHLLNHCDNELQAALLRHVTRYLRRVDSLPLCFSPDRLKGQALRRIQGPCLAPRRRPKELSTKSRREAGSRTPGTIFPEDRFFSRPISLGANLLGDGGVGGGGLRSTLHKSTLHEGSGPEGGASDHPVLPGLVSRLFQALKLRGALGALSGGASVPYHERCTMRATPSVCV